jgi:hypothetical protein
VLIHTGSIEMFAMLAATKGSMHPSMTPMLLTGQCIQDIKKILNRQLISL